jgi:translation initiation factor SUI1
MNLIGPYDPFKDITEKQNNVTLEKITIHVLQRKINKYITTIEGLVNHGIDPETFLKDIRKQCSCNGTYNKTEQAIQIQGNHRIQLAEILTEEYNIAKNMIISRGV